MLLWLFFSALHLTAGLSNSSDLLDLLLSVDADVDAMNDDLCSPLFYATQSNNLYAASLLLNHGKLNKQQGLTRQRGGVVRVSDFRSGGRGSKSRSDHKGGVLGRP